MKVSFKFEILFIIVYFILKGSVIMHIDLNDPSINPNYHPKDR